MNLKELNSTLFNKKLTLIATVEWSEDDNISVISEAGIHIFKLKPNSSNFYNSISLQKCFIPDIQTDPTKILNITPSELIYNIGKEELYNLIRNPLLISLNNTKFVNTAISVMACWSPAGLLSYTQCVLCTLTNLGSIGIYINRHDEMILLTDISKLRAEYVVQRFKDKDMNDYNKLTKLAPEIRTNCVSWGSLINNYCFLYTGHTNGEICVWKIEHITNNLVKEVTPKLIYIFSTSHDIITCIYTTTSGDNISLIVGYDNGIVEYFTLFLDNDTQTLSKKEESILLWSYIDTKVTNIKSVRWGKDTIFIIIKGHNIIAILVDESGAVLETRMKRLRPITGIQEISPTEFVLSTYNGVIYLLQLFKAEDGSFDLHEIKVHCDVDFRHYGLFGIVRSKRKCLWGLVLSVNEIYDHNSLKTPSSITFCTSDRFAPMRLLKENHLQKLTNSWDCLEALRCTIIQKETPCITEHFEKFDNISTYELKLLLWTIILNDSLNKKENDKQEAAVQYKIALADTVHMRHAVTKLEEILANFIANEFFLNEFHSRSAYCLISFLEIYKKKYKHTYGNQSIVTIDKVLKESSIIPKHVLDEKCNICDTELTDLCCSFKHPVSRCMISLVQLPPTAFLACLMCGRLGHPELEERPPHCIWCDGILINEYNLADNIIEEEDDTIKTKTVLKKDVVKKTIKNEDAIQEEMQMIIAEDET